MSEGKETVRNKHENIYSALSAFQGELQPIDTIEVDFPTKSGARIKFKYSPLGKIMEVIHPILAKHGLAVRHETTKDGVECILTHETYRTEQVKTGTETEYAEDGSEKRTVEHYSTIVHNELRSGLVPAQRTGDMKDIGSAITYARRYSLTMLLGISSEEDKDVQFEEASKRNVESFAMLKARENIDKASGKELEKQIIFLEKELKTLAEKKTPSLGFKKENYDELLAYARTRKEDEDAKHSVDDTPAVEGEPVDVSDE